LMKALPRSEVLKDFIFHLLQEQRLHAFVVGRSERTAGQSGVNLELLEKYPAYLPPISLQREFARRVTAVEALKTAQRASLTELDALFATLQHRAFRGEL
jgi:type I restriction enzyme S subunit